MIQATFRFKQVSRSYPFCLIEWLIMVGIGGFICFRVKNIHQMGEKPSPLVSNLGICSPVVCDMCLVVLSIQIASRMHSRKQAIVKEAYFDNQSSRSFVINRFVVDMHLMEISSPLNMSCEEFNDTTHLKNISMVTWTLCYPCSPHSEYLPIYVCGRFYSCR